ncbi:hypothetical protein ACHAWF_003048 [Thalassiosira exigua]
MDAPLVAPKMMTMDRFGDTKQIIVAQSTSQCCRTGMCQPSINWVIREADNFHGGNPHTEYEQQAWIHEESTFCMRCWSCCAPGCRAVKYVQHTSTVPSTVVSGEDYNWCTCQRDVLPKGLTEEDRNKDVIATHEKGQTCTACCCFEPYLETKDADGNIIGKTQYVCDLWIFVPKFDIFDGSGNKKYRLRPDTCIGGCCIMCRCGGEGGKCCRVPFVVRDPNTFAPIKGNMGAENAQATELWSGWKNEWYVPPILVIFFLMHIKEFSPILMAGPVPPQYLPSCTKRNAYHLVFPDDASAEDKLTLIGSSILIDMIYAEQDDDNGGGGGGGGGGGQ